MDKRVIAALLGPAALAVPTAAAADPGHGAGHGHKPSTPAVNAKHQRTGKTKKTRPVMFVFKGSFTAPGTVAVVSGNAQARHGGFVGQPVTFDLSGAKVVAGDSNADSAVDVSDVRDGDVVLIQARLPKGTKFVAPADGTSPEPIAARKLIDKTNPPETTEEPTA
jgi:hypothetical protein